MYSRHEKQEQAIGLFNRAEEVVNNALTTKERADRIERYEPEFFELPLDSDQELGQVVNITSQSTQGVDKTTIAYSKVYPSKVDPLVTIVKTVKRTRRGQRVSYDVTDHNSGHPYRARLTKRDNGSVIISAVEGMDYSKRKAKFVQKKAFRTERKLQYGRVVIRKAKEQQLAYSTNVVTLERVHSARRIARARG